MCDEEEPLTFNEAKSSKNWMAAMQAEYDAIVKNGTWSLCDLLAGKKTIGTKWVYKLNLSLMVVLIAIRLDLLQKGMLRKRALTSKRLLLPLVV